DGRRPPPRPQNHLYERLDRHRSDCPLRAPRDDPAQTLHRGGARRGDQDGVARRIATARAGGFPRAQRWAKVAALISPPFSPLWIAPCFEPSSSSLSRSASSSMQEVP